MRGRRVASIDRGAMPTIENLRSMASAKTEFNALSRRAAALTVD